MRRECDEIGCAGGDQGATSLTKLVKPDGFQVFGSVSAHSLLFFAEVLFLCTLATWAAEKRDAKP